MMMNIPQKDAADYSAGGEGQTCELEVPPDMAGLRLDLALARLMPEHSRSRLQAWLKAGRVAVDGVAAADAKRKLWGGERIAVSPGEAPQAGADRPEAIDLDVAYEDESILVIDKPAGLVVHPGSGNWSGTLLNALLHHAPQLQALPRAGIVHRLDKDTSGLMVVAKTETAQTDLVRQLQSRSVGRRYLAVAVGEVRGGGTVDAPIGRHPTQRTKMAVVERGRPARTHYTVRERFPGATLVECALETGRTHQIRVHLASLGHPLLGDPVYGRKAPRLPHFPRQALHAWRLRLIHPATGDDMEWESPLPQDMRELLEALRSAGGEQAS